MNSISNAQTLKNNMHRILVQRKVRSATAPASIALRRFAKHALKDRIAAAEMTICIVTEMEMTRLNGTYRGKYYPTNVLSFPFDMPAEVTLDLPILGDLVICAKVVEQEALAQHKSITEHWAHMVVHGVLHLLGHDHEEETAANHMEAEEIAILAKLGFANPYFIPDTGNKPYV